MVMNFKRVIVVALNLALMALLYGVLINQTKVAMQNAKRKAGAYISQAHLLWDDIMRGLPIVVAIYLFWAVLRRFVLKRQNIILASVVTGIIMYALFSFLFAFGAGGKSSLYWMSMLPFLIIGILLPMMEYGLLTLFQKKPTKSF